MTRDDRSDYQDGDDDEIVAGGRRTSGQLGARDGDGSDNRDRDGRGTDEVTISCELRIRVNSPCSVKLRSPIRYVNAQLESKEAQTESEGVHVADESKSAVAGRSTEPEGGEGDDQPEGVPSKAAGVVREIDDNRYYDWQWRDGDSVKSKNGRPAHSE